MSLVCRVAEVTNERWETIYKHWPLKRVHEAEVIWYGTKGYSCRAFGSQGSQWVTTID